MSIATRFSVTAAMAAMCLTGLTRQVRADSATAPAPTDATAPQPAAAAPAADNDEDKWSFSAPLFMWAPSLNGTVTARGQSLRVSQSFTDLYDHMNKGFTAYLQLAKPQYGFYVAPNYYDLLFNGKVGPIKGRLETQLWIIDMMGMYRIWDHEGDRPAALYAIGGARYWNLHNNVRIQSAGTAASNNWLLDPTIGLRFTDYITKNLHLMVQSDMGGFDMGQQTSRFSWELIADLGYDFTMPVIKKPSTFFAGWRQINDQHSQGSTGYNLNFAGPIVGLSVSLF
jgi:hypothetical protein